MEDGWIEWAGWECPVEPDTPVQIRDREGGEDGPRTAREWCWDWMPTWPESDIVAYRVVPA